MSEQAYVLQEPGYHTIEGATEVPGYTVTATGPIDPSQSDSGIKDPLAYIGKPGYTEAEKVAQQSRDPSESLVSQLY